MRVEPYRGNWPFEKDYLGRFGFSRRPFALTPDPAFYFESASHKEAMACLRAFLSQREALALVFGDVGTGKTIFSRHFLDSITQEGFNAGLIINPTSNKTDFLSEACEALGLDDIFSTKDPMKNPQKGPGGAKRGGKGHVLAIDEAQLLSDPVLRFVAGLSSGEAQKSLPLHIILVGQDEIVSNLLPPEMGYLRRRIKTTCRLEPLREGEISHYIEHRLSVAGSKGKVGFTEDAVRLLYASSRGYPRIINTLCNHCLLLLSSQSDTLVSQKMVRQAMAGRL
jgi:general secretion pathway protein A